MSRPAATGIVADRGRMLRATGPWLLGAPAILVVTAYLAEQRPLSGTEIAVFRLVNGAPGLLFVPVWTVMQLGSLLAVPAIALAVAATRRFLLAAAVLIGGLATYYLAKPIKDEVHRARPGRLLPDVHLHGAPALGRGYPSGHAAVACLILTVLWPYLGPRSRAVAVVLAATVCLARVYVGAHLPLDVIGGAALGIGVGLLVRLFLPTARRPATSAQ